MTATEPMRGTRERVQVRRTVLACMADYIDAGSIVAASSGLALWSAEFGMSKSTVGLLGALGTNAASYAVGALIGGRLGDVFGRKRIYQYDLLIYVLGGLLVMAAFNSATLFIGLIIMGLAVGADVPTSWALVGEIAPERARGRAIGLTSLFWSLGPVVSLLLALALADLGVLGIRIVFGQLVVVAFVTWFLRRRMGESEIWVDAQTDRAQVSAAQLRALLRPALAKPLVFVFAVHTLGSVAAGTFGFFLPYILKTVGAKGQAASVGLNALNFALVGLGVAFLFMPLVDRVNRRLLYGVAGVFSVVAALLLIVFPVTNSTAIVAFIVINALASSCGQEQLYRVWCQELFPTMLRSTAQGAIIFAQKMLLAGWSLVVPLIVARSFSAFAWILAIATFLSVLIGTVYMPRRPQSLATVR
ncbi:MFS transporter [Kribbella sp. NPDC051586]|uniref:MFS transporter n=1 Tax=Kribbella sp. NPDC051586 TaxID=3364118 RepID=UPI00378F12C1